MSEILIINPNTTERTTAMMVAVARRCLPPGVLIRGATAADGSAMIVDEAALARSAEEVVRIGLAEGPRAGAVIVAAFGDPGIARLRAGLSVEVVGIGEAALREAATGGAALRDRADDPGPRRRDRRHGRGTRPRSAFHGRLRTPG